MALGRHQIKWFYDRVGKQIYSVKTNSILTVIDHRHAKNLHLMQKLENKTFKDFNLLSTTPIK